MSRRHKSCTRAAPFFTSLLNKADLPTLGRPTIATCKSRVASKDGVSAISSIQVKIGVPMGGIGRQLPQELASKRKSSSVFAEAAVTIEQGVPKLRV